MPALFGLGLTHGGCQRGIWLRSISPGKKRGSSGRSEQGTHNPLVPAFFPEQVTWPFNSPSFRACASPGIGARPRHPEKIDGSLRSDKMFSVWFDLSECQERRTAWRRSRESSGRKRLRLGPSLLILLFGTHVYLTIRLRFIQRYLGKAIRLSFQRSDEGEGDVSQFGALTTALAATIGTGNIVGVATAVAAGGRARCSGCGSPASSASRPSTPRPALREVPRHDADRAPWPAARCTSSSAG